MPNPVCIFDLRNDGPGEMTLYLEPEGGEFILPVGKAVQVLLFDGGQAIEMCHATDENGQRIVSFWPAQGRYELLYEGKDVWEEMRWTSGPR